MALGTYVEPFATLRDELRCLFQDNETDGTTVVPDAIVSDDVYDKALTDKGDIAGAVFLALVYASYYALQIKKYANTRGGTSVEWVEREKFYRGMAADISSGLIVIGEGAPGGGIQRGAMTVGLEKDAFFELNNFWPEELPTSPVI